MRMINTINEHLAKIWLLGSMVVAVYLHTIGDPMTFPAYVGLCMGWLSLCMRSPIEVHGGYGTMGHSQTNELKRTDLDERKSKHIVVEGVKQPIRDVQMPCQQSREGKLKHS